MKRYWHNLLTALLGKNPFQQELEELNKKYNKASENVMGLNELYYKAVEKREENTKTLRETLKDLVRYQTLVENLRERMSEKDALIAQLQAELDKK